MKRKYFPLLITVFIAAAVLIRLEDVLRILGKIWNVTVPLFGGVLAAAVLDPAVRKTEEILKKLFRRKKNHTGKGLRYASIAVIFTLIAAALAAVIYLVIPALIDSAKLLGASIGDYYSVFRKRCEAASGRDPLGLVNALDRLIESISESSPELLKHTFSATATIIATITNILISLVISVYLLAAWDSVISFTDAALLMILGEERHKKTAHVICVANSCFVSFVCGQLTEALLLGTLCFAGMICFGFEYPLLISTLIGMTALIPVVGAFAGAVPSVMLLFLVKPSSALWFTVFIIVLQQLENNLIYPKVVGRSVGLPPVLILIAIITGAGLGGVWGILIGIPLLSAAYSLIMEKFRTG